MNQEKTLRHPILVGREADRRRWNIDPVKIVIYLILIAWSIPIFFLLFWVINNSFKPSAEVLTQSFKLADGLNWMNYLSAFKKVDIIGGYINSLIISGSVALTIILLGGMAAYVLTRYNFPGKKLIFTLLMGSWLFPIFATIVPSFFLLFKMQLIYNYWGLILLQAAVNMPFSIIIMKGYMTSIPVEMEEAAFMEGCTTLQTYFRIIIPIAKPTFVTVGITSFLWSYNDLFTALVVVRNRELQPVSVLLNELSSQYGMDFGLMAAAVTIVIIPVIVLYFLAQKHIVKGLTAGAVKG